MIRVVYPGSGSWFFTHPGSRGQKGDPGFATLIQRVYPYTIRMYLRLVFPDPRQWFHKNYAQTERWEIVLFLPGYGLTALRSLVPKNSAFRIRQYFDGSGSADPESWITDLDPEPTFKIFGPFWIGSKSFKIAKKIELFLKFLWIFDKIVRIWLLLTNPDSEIHNAELRIRIQEANYFWIHRNRSKTLLKSLASNLQEEKNLIWIRTEWIRFEQNTTNKIP